MLLVLGEGPNGFESVLSLDTSNRIRYHRISLEKQPSNQRQLKLEIKESTHHVDLELSTAITNTLQDLLHLDNETLMKNRSSKFDMTKVTWTFGHAFETCLTFKIPVDGCKENTKRVNKVITAQGGTTYCPSWDPSDLQLFASHSHPRPRWIRFWRQKRLSVANISGCHSHCFFGGGKA